MDSRDGDYARLYGDFQSWSMSLLFYLVFNPNRKGMLLSQLFVVFLYTHGMNPWSKPDKASMSQIRRNIYEDKANQSSSLIVNTNRVQFYSQVGHQKQWLWDYTKTSFSYKPGMQPILNLSSFKPWKTAQIKRLTKRPIGKIFLTQSRILELPIGVGERKGYEGSCKYVCRTTAHSWGDGDWHAASHFWHFYVVH